MFGFSGWRKNVALCISIFVAIFLLARLYYHFTDDIRLANMSHPIPYHKEWDIPPLSPVDQQHMDTILDQPYHYIGKGAQSYAFGSEDGQYVLKFFKFKHLRPSWFLEMLPSVGPIKQYQEKQRARKQKNLVGVFTGYRLAYEVHKDASGILFIHLNTTDNLHKTVILKDKLGLTFEVDLDQYVFILQEKAMTTRAVVRQMLENGDVAGAKQRIGQIIDLYKSEYQKGIYDHDHGVMHNTGFVGNKPIHLDVGKLSSAPEMKNPEPSNADLKRVINKMHLWIHQNHSQYADEIDKEIEIKMSEVLGQPWTFQR